jgi:SagB-type dehydrogenase family enzyme
MTVSALRALLFSLLVLAVPGSAIGEKGILLLPQQKTKGAISLEESVASRRTRRAFHPKPLKLEELGQLLWAAQGITGADGNLRAAPSAGALYPLDLYAVVGESSVQGLEAGIYHYVPSRHGLEQIAHDDVRKEVARASLRQMWMAEAPVSLVLTAEYRRIEGKYGPRGRRYAIMEIGHAGQNIFLQAEALGLGAGIVGAFDDAGLAKVLHLPPTHEPLIVMPVGHPRGR